MAIVPVVDARLDVQAVEWFDPDTIDRLLHSYTFYPYRHWRGFGADVPRTLLRWGLLQRRPGKDSLCLLAMDDTGPVGLAVVEPSPWESEQLGIQVAGLRHLIAVGEGPTRRKISHRLLAAVRAHLGETISCLIHRLDSGDYETMAILETEGFRLVDTSLSFVRGPGFRPYLRRAFRTRSVVRPYQEADWPAVEAITRRTWFGGHWYHDGHVPQARVDSLYLEWVRQCCRKNFADEVLVALRGGQVAGFLSYQFQQDLSAAAQIRLMGRGLLAVASDQRGLALELIRTACLSEARADFLQCDIHLENLELLGVYGRALRMDIVHVRHVFHAWWRTEHQRPDELERAAQAVG